MPVGEEELRGVAHRLVEAALRAVDPLSLTEAFLRANAGGIAAGARVRVLGAGKAVVRMARGAQRALGPRIAGGVVVAPRDAAEADLPGIDRHVGDHPCPDESGARGARAMAESARAAGDEDLVLALLSGGASALMALPPAGIPIRDLRATTAALQRAGAGIEALNTVRKQLDRLKGGRLARLIEPARVLALVLSDVVGDRLDLIGSGPLVPAGGGYAEAIEALESHGCWDSAPASVRAHLECGVRGEREAPPAEGESCFGGVAHHVIGNTRTALDAVGRTAASLGYRARIEAAPVVGEARQEGRRLGRLARTITERSRPAGAPVCLLSGGETTVRVTGPGRGGRNLELALGALPELAGLERACLVSLATDGRDGTAPAAGALVTGTSSARAEELGLDAAAALLRNDSYPFFKALGDLLTPGPTGTNVADIQILLVGQS